MTNLAQLILAASRTNPDAPFGTFLQNDRLERVLERAQVAAAAMGAAGLGRGVRAAVVGANSAAYLVTWLAGQLAGVQTALINPSYPDQLLGEMLDNLEPEAVIWVGRHPGAFAQRDMLQLDTTDAWDGKVVTLRAGKPACLLSGAGGDCESHDIAAFIHTSGTSGTPKFCALSHEYLIRLGRYFADVMGLGRFDILANPLPLFHINPIGNSVVGALTANAGFLSMEKFSATEFWPLVVEHGVTALVLHGPPSSMLKSKTRPEDAAGHKVRIGFYCDPSFLEMFDIPIGVGGYGSTEAGGYCHSQKFRQGDRDFPPEGATHLSGQPRFDVEWKLSDEDEIWVREKAPNVLFSGYARGGRIDPHRDAEGWFHTGDRGRVDACGNLIFVERASESIRVNAEYVPIDFVEERLKRVPSLQEFALWRLDSPTRGHEAVVYTTSARVDVAALRASVADLPRYMHPTKVIRIAAIPRDAGVGKTQRRLLGAQPVLETIAI